MDERRHDYPKILEALEDIKKDVTEMRIESTKIATLVEERNDSAIVWRGEVCKKFDRIFSWLEKLPCKERTLNTRLVWGAIALIGGILLTHLGWK